MSDNETIKAEYEKLIGDLETDGDKYPEETARRMAADYKTEIRDCFRNQFLILDTVRDFLDRLRKFLKSLPPTNDE